LFVRQNKKKYFIFAELIPMIFLTLYVFKKNIFYYINKKMNFHEIPYAMNGALVQLSASSPYAYFPTYYSELQTKEENCAKACLQKFKTEDVNYSECMNFCLFPQNNKK
jgi:hypothetical protein